MTDDIQELDEVLKEYLAAVHRLTEAGGASKASMYAVGATLGMDRPDAKRAGEALIGMGLVEVRTLSGDIALSDEGLAACARLLGPDHGGAAAAEGLSQGPVLDAADRALTEQMAARLKYLAGEKSWAFDTLSDLMADLKTIDAQLLSSQPKTAIIAACFRSVQGLLRGNGHSEAAGEIGRLLGDGR